MTRDNARGHRLNRLLKQVTSHSPTPSASTPGAHYPPTDVGLQELETRLLLSASGLDSFNGPGKLAPSDVDAWLNRPVAQIDLSAQAGNGSSHGIENPSDDHGDDAANSTSVQTDTTIIGDIEVVADQDWFGFLGQTGIHYVFETALLGIIDTSLVLYDTDGTTVLAFDDDGGPGLASRLTWTAPSQGTYFLAVRGFDTQTGAYSVTMSDNAIPTGEIRGTKWNDLNFDGIRDPGEPGLEGWTIFIDENRNRKRDQGERSVVTDENGDYVFTNMRPGTYTIAEKAQPGWQQTSPGEDGATASSNPAAAGFGAGGVVIHRSSVNEPTFTNESGEVLLLDDPLLNAQDVSGPIEFNAPGDKWPQPGGLGTTALITYSYSNLLDGGLLGGLTAAAITTAIEEALDLWASFAPLKFVMVPDTGPAPSDNPYPAGAHPNIRFGHHAIDGDSSVLAHAFFPEGTGLSGDIHFDNEDTWSIGPSGNSIDLIEVAVHEIGHALGLGHEPEPPAGADAIMNPFYGERYNGFSTSFLLDDDVAGIHSLYGEVQALLGVWSVTINNPGEIAEDVDFGNFLNDDHGNDAGSASPAAAHTIVSGNIESFGDVDWFHFEAGGGQAFSFETLLDTGIEDTIVRLYDKDGVTQIGTDDDGGIALASKLPWVAPSDGTYYIEVTGFKANIGDYMLRIAASSLLVEGDLDGDGFVGVADLNIILSFWNQTVPEGEILFGDPSADGYVGIDDLNLVLGNWNEDAPEEGPLEISAGGENTLVPETADQDEVTAADQSTRPQKSVRATRDSDSRADRAPGKLADRLDLSHTTREALAAWSRNPVQIPRVNSIGSVLTATESDESEGLLGLWSDDTEV
jgi:hypothetical protein